MRRFLVLYGYVFVAHVFGQFLIYGHAEALPSFARNEIGVFLVPLICVFLAYSWALSKAPLLRSEPRRVVTVIVLSLLSSLVSLFVGLFWAFNTYGT